ncbi:hypothetical protein CXF95_22230 [Paraglaciecola sp. MB-3u-78]|nr:hypothetical protein CXF95_22230 [Paraglaciecola sp. MB-3u-78]
MQSTDIDRLLLGSQLPDSMRKNPHSLVVISTSSKTEVNPTKLFDQGLTENQLAKIEAITPLPSLLKNIIQLSKHHWP